MNLFIYGYDLPYLDCNSSPYLLFPAMPTREALLLPEMGGDPLYFNFQEEEQQQQQQRGGSMSASRLSVGSRRNIKVLGVGRQTLGIAILMGVVAAWTSSNFLTSVSRTSYRP